MIPGTSSGLLGSNSIFECMGNGSATLHDTTSCLRVLTAGFALPILICRCLAFSSQVNTNGIWPRQRAHGTEFLHHPLLSTGNSNAIPSGEFGSAGRTAPAIGGRGRKFLHMRRSRRMLRRRARAGPGCLNRISALISGASAGFRPPSGMAAG